jgi:hypothetical protein
MGADGTIVREEIHTVKTVYEDTREAREKVMIEV